MLTENRKRQRSGGDEESGHLVPQAKRQSRAHPLSPEPGRDAWDSESSNSETSCSPEHAAVGCSSQCVGGPCSPFSSGDSSEMAGPTNLVSYLQINRILKHAHFQSLQSRCQLRHTWRPDAILCQPAEDCVPLGRQEHHSLIHPTQLFPPSSSYCDTRSSAFLWMETSSWSGIWRGGFIIQKKIKRDNHFSNNICVINLNITFVIHFISDQSGLHAALGALLWLIDDDKSLCFVLNVVWNSATGTVEMAPNTILGRSAWLV